MAAICPINTRNHHVGPRRSVQHSDSQLAFQSSDGMRNKQTKEWNIFDRFIGDILTFETLYTSLKQQYPFVQIVGYHQVIEFYYSTT